MRKIRIGEVLNYLYGTQPVYIDRALWVQKNPIKPLGQVLVENGVIQNGQLDAALKYQQLMWEQLEKDNQVFESAITGGLIEAEEINDMDPLQDKALNRVVELAKEKKDSSFKSLDEYLDKVLGKEKCDYLLQRCNLVPAGNDMSWNPYHAE